MSESQIEERDRWQRALEGISKCLDEISYSDELRSKVLELYELVWKRVVESRKISETD